MDSMTGALKKRLNAYSEVTRLFSFFHELFDLQTTIHTQLHKAPRYIAEAYPDDINCGPAYGTGAIFPLRSRISSDMKQNDETASFELQLYRIVSSPGVQEAFPNVNIALRIHLTLLVPNYSGERSFSAPERIKNDLRTSMSDQR